MNRQQKEQLVSTLKKEFTDAQGAYLVGYQGLSVEDLRLLRNKLRENKAVFKVAKMRLVRRALTDELKDFDPCLKEQRGIVFSYNEPTIVAKTLHDFAKDHEQLNIVLGFVEKEVIGADVIKVIASLPPREVLLAQALGMMKSPILQLAQLLNVMLVRLIFVLQQISEKKAKES